jgi:hypothetical protein
MLKRLDYLAPLADEYAKSVDSVVIDDMVIPVESSARRSFTIVPHDDQSSNLKNDTDASSVYVSYNDTLKFTDQIGRLCHFTLLRYKKAFKVDNRLIGAELLDISIPYADEEKSIENFHHYKSEQWTHIVVLS